MTDFPALHVGLLGSATHPVTGAMTATSIGSGTVDVLATPIMVALMEAAAVDCVEERLPAGHATLGTHLDITHIAPTPVGGTVTATAELLSIDGRTLVFGLEARDGHEIIGEGRHTRIVVDAGRFAAKVARKHAPPE